MSQLRIQDSRAVAYRALCLGALLKRGEWELAVHNANERYIFDDVRERVLQKHQVLNDNLHRWLSVEKITAHLSASEKIILNKTFGTW